MPTSLVSTGVQFPDNTIQTTAASASGTITATASGAINAGNPVVLNSNGTVSAVSGVANGVAFAQSVPAEVRSSGYRPFVAQNFGIVYAYDASIDRVVGIFIDNQNAYGTSRPMSFIGTPTADGLDFSWVRVTVSTTSVGTASAAVIASNQAGTFIAMFYDGGINYYYSVGTYNSSTNLVSWGPLNTAPSFTTTYYMMGLQFVPTANRWALVLIDDGSGSTTGVANAVYCSIFSLSGTTLTYVTRGTYTAAFGNLPVFTNGWNNMNWTATDNGSIVTAVIGFTGYNRTNAIAFRVTASSVTPSNAVNELNAAGGDEFPTVVYNAAAAAFVVAYADTTNTDLRIRSFTVTTSGTPTITLGTAVTLTAGSFTSLRRVGFYSPSGTCAGFVFNSSESNPGASLLRNITVTTSGTTSTVCAQGYAFMGAGETGSNRELYAPKVMRGAVAPMFYTPVLVGSQSVSVQAPLIINFSGNLTATNFLGFSAGTYANGATATITTVGGTNTSQSGLTTGRASYVNGNGVLGVGPSVPAAYGGIPLSATSILVKG